MSIDERAEENLQKALAVVWALPFPRQRRRILKNALRDIMRALKITRAELVEETNDAGANKGS